MERFFVIGDIHGCPMEVETLLAALRLTSQDRVVFLGDYVDRGLGAREVVDILLDLRDDQSCQLTFLKGNHEDMFLDFLGYEGCYGESFLGNGGVATLRSYQVPQYAEGKDAAFYLPPDHLQFFLTLETFFEAGEILCVHAGINPQLPLVEQSVEEMLWIRQEFLDHPHRLPYTVLFGHTPQRDVLFDLPYKVGLDTGLVYGGKLSCLELTEKKLFQIARGDRKVRMTNVADIWKKSAVGTMASRFF